MNIQYNMFIPSSFLLYLMYATTTTTSIGIIMKTATEATVIPATQAPSQPT